MLNNGTNIREVHQMEPERNMNQRGVTDRNLRNNQDFFMERDKPQNQNFENNQMIMNPVSQNNDFQNQSIRFLKKLII